VRRIIWRELVDRKWSLFWYCFAAVALLWTYAATYKSSLASSQQLLEVIKSYPKALIDAFGLNSLAGSSVEQYLNGKHFSFLWPLMAILMALSRAGSQLAGEIQDRTMGLLLAMPLPRIAIFAAKYVAGVLTIVVFTALSVFPIIPLASAYGIETHPRILVAMWVLTTLFMWSVYAFGLLVSSFVSQPGRVYALGAAALLVSYMANIVALLSDKVGWLKQVSLFHYFDTATVLGTGHIGASAIIVFVAVIVAASAAAAWRFNNRDIHV
jgi:ABC-2 type transport system permease protein